MNIEFSILNAILSTLGVYFLLLKIGIYRVCGYDFLVDATFTIILMLFYMGTLHGSIIAVMGGTMLSILLYLTKRSLGEVHRYSFLRRRWEAYNV